MGETYGLPVNGIGEGMAKATKKRITMVYPEETKKKALILMAGGMLPAQVSKELGIPYGTLATWRLQNRNTAEYKQYERTAKEKFIEDAWDIIGSGTKILKRKLERINEREEQIDDLLELAKKDMSIQEKKELAKQLANIKIENPANLVPIIGMFYDKQAIAHGEATSRKDILMGIVRFEDM